ncbi:hypothetical protein [Streptomyces sp. NPDC059378]
MNDASAYRGGHAGTGSGLLRGGRGAGRLLQLAGSVVRSVRYSRFRSV